MRKGGTGATLGERAWAAARLLREAYGTPRFAGGEDPLGSLIETILSQKTTGPSCRLAFDRLRRACDGDWDRLPALPLAAIEAAIAPAGLARSKAPRLVAVVERVARDFGAASLERLTGMDDEAAGRYLESLPGVGPKTAKCVLMFALGREVLPVDTHVGRVDRRLGLVAAGLSDRRLHAELAVLVPPAERYAFHLNAYRHGRGVCRSLRPRCQGCCLNDLCPSAVLPAEPPLATGTSATFRSSRGGDNDSRSAIAGKRRLNRRRSAVAPTVDRAADFQQTGATPRRQRR